MNIQVIKEADAPAIPKKRSRAAEELLAALDRLRKDEVLKLDPDTGKSVRGLKTGVGRITKSAGVKVTTWDDGMSVYVKK
ncbi:MAG TPA: hypothetical protein VD767_08445 [Thermomicrobiales bacterium]|nr:hypothetical protein [Thermomicrobiales bacterium]